MTFRVVLIPDTQLLSASAVWIAHFQAAADWIDANAAGIDLVLGLGDCVDDGSTTQYDRAEIPMQTIYDTGIPFMPAIGNHDYNSGIPSGRNSALWNSYFGTGQYTGRPWWDGDFKDAGLTDNMYTRLTINGQNMLVFVLEFGPTTATMAWVDSVIDAHPDRDVIVATHSYLFNNGDWVTDSTPDSPSTYGLASYTVGRDMWVDHFEPVPLMRAVFSGHHIGGSRTAFRYDLNSGGRRVVQQFSNWQQDGQGGDGRIVVMDVEDDWSSGTRQVFNARNDAFEPQFDLSFQEGPNTMPRNYTNASLTTIDGNFTVLDDPISVVDGSEWPATDFTVAVWDQADPKLLKAVILVGARTGNSLSGLTWNFDGHADVNIANGDIVALAAIADDYVQVLGDVDRVETSESTTSGTFTNLATAGPEVTVSVPDSGVLLVSLHALMLNSDSASGAAMGFVLSGANVLAASDGRAISIWRTTTVAPGQRFGSTFMVSGLNPGSTTITAEYRRLNAGTATFAERELSVVVGLAT